MQNHYTSWNKYQWLEMDGRLNVPRKVDFRSFLCLGRKKKSPFLFKQVMWAIARVLHNLICEATPVTCVPWSEFSILGISAHLVKKKEKEIDHVALQGDLIMTCFYGHWKNQ